MVTQSRAAAAELTAVQPATGPVGLTCPAAGAACPVAPAPHRRRTSDDQVNRIFSVSILLSAFRCLLSYIFLPVVTPALGLATGVGPALGIPVGVLALVFDVLGIRRFWLADHRLKWPMTFVYAAVMAMVAVLLARDVAHFAG